MEVYSNLGTELPDGSISVDFNKKLGGLDDGRQSVPFDPFGKSGGAIFGLPLDPNRWRCVAFVVDGSHIRLRQTSRLIGFPTRWERAEQRIKGSSITVLIPLLDELVR